MPANLSESFLKYSRTKQIFAQTDTIIVAISGGMDSVVLAHLLKSLNQPMVLAHCNFQLRGEESIRDEQFVKSLAGSLEIPLYRESYDTTAYAAQHKLGIQVAARQLRYDFFERLRTKLSVSNQRVLTATAHHANDNVETLLFNLFRGTGIDGLRGIPIQNGHIVRPLLFATREMIEEYARLHKLSWVEDSSNAKEAYARNYIRHKVLPAIEAQFPQALQNMAGTIEKVNAAATFYHEMVDIRLKKMVVQEGEVQKVPVLKLSKSTQSTTLIWEWLKPFGFSEGQVGEVVKLFTASNGSYIKSATHRLLRNRAWLILVDLNLKNRVPQIIEGWNVALTYADSLVLEIKQPQKFALSEGFPNLPTNQGAFDAGNIQFPLILRPWKAGDYFYPLGMAKKKKVARFLIDQKVSPSNKEKVWVLESNKRILWVVGYRMDDRFKLTAKTTQFVSIQVNSKPV